MKPLCSVLVCVLLLLVFGSDGTEARKRKKRSLGYDGEGFHNDLWRMATAEGLQASDGNFMDLNDFFADLTVNNEEGPPPPTTEDEEERGEHFPDLDGINDGGEPPMWQEEPEDVGQQHYDEREREEMPPPSYQEMDEAERREEEEEERRQAMMAASWSPPPPPPLSHHMQMQNDDRDDEENEMRPMMMMAMPPRPLKRPEEEDGGESGRRHPIRARPSMMSPDEGAGKASASRRVKAKEMSVSDPTDGDVDGDKSSRRKRRPRRKETKRKEKRPPPIMHKEIISEDELERRQEIRLQKFEEKRRLQEERRERHRIEMEAYEREKAEFYARLREEEEEPMMDKEIISEDELERRQQMRLEKFEEKRRLQEERRERHRIEMEAYERERLREAEQLGEDESLHHHDDGGVWIPPNMMDDGEGHHHGHGHGHRRKERGRRRSRHRRIEAVQDLALDRQRAIAQYKQNVEDDYYGVFVDAVKPSAKAAAELGLSMNSFGLTEDELQLANDMGRDGTSSKKRYKSEQDRINEEDDYYGVFVDAVKGNVNKKEEKEPPLPDTSAVNTAPAAATGHAAGGNFFSGEAASMLMLGMDEKNSARPSSPAMPTKGGSAARGHYGYRGYPAAAAAASASPMNNKHHGSPNHLGHHQPGAAKPAPQAASSLFYGHQSSAPMMPSSPMASSSPMMPSSPMSSPSPMMPQTSPMKATSPLGQHHRHVKMGHHNKAGNPMPGMMAPGMMGQHFGAGQMVNVGGGHGGGGRHHGYGRPFNGIGMTPNAAHINAALMK